jgi:DNA-binding transcriptional MocR family regulator
MADKIMWSPDLTQGCGPLYLRLVDAIACAIEAGALTVGERLPAQRQLAWHLGINLSTVTKAFQEATKRHLIAGEVGRGTYVLAQSAEAALFELKHQTGRSIVDLSTHIPAEKPGDSDLNRALTDMLSSEQDVATLLNYHSPQALLEIRIACASWYAQLGYAVEPSRCIATSSAQHALLVTLLACCGSDETVLVDQLTFPSMKTVAKQLGLKLHGVKMDQQGIIPDALDLAIRSTGAKVLVSDPILQNPTGSCMGKERQLEFTNLLHRHDILFIEEFVIGALTGITPVSAALKEKSVLITSFAKTVSPGLRFAMIAGKHPVIDKLNAEPYATSWQLSPLIDTLACKWINDGTAMRRLKWQWQEVQRRHRLFQKIFPNNQYLSSAEPCSHVWLPVTEPAEQVAKHCSDLGVEVVPASLFAVSRNYAECIRVSLTAAKTLREVTIGLEIIRDTGMVKNRG